MRTWLRRATFVSLVLWLFVVGVAVVTRDQYLVALQLDLGRDVAMLIFESRDVNYVFVRNSPEGSGLTYGPSHPFAKRSFVRFSRDYNGSGYLRWRAMGSPDYKNDVPVVSVLSAMALPSALWVLAVVRRKAKRGTCVKCGYDLRGSTGATCPECGAELGPHN